MKNLILLMLVVCMLGGCSKETNEPEENPCTTPSISVTVSNASASFYVNTGNFGFLEIEYGSNGFSRGSGTTATVSNQHTINNLTNGTYDLYIRGNCGGTSWSNWSNPYSFLIQNGNSSTCPTPSNLETNVNSSSIRLGWNHAAGDYYEVEYGPTGFAIGSGVRIIENNKYYYGGAYSANTTYDFYVRANCGADDWSPWSEPKSFFTDHNVNRCLPPTNLNAYRSSSSTIDYDFDPNGEDSWEVTLLLSQFTSPDDGNIISKSSPYGGYINVSSSTRYFYARAVCSNGNRTAWVGPVVIN